jgi:hypothetical protein
VKYEEKYFGTHVTIIRFATVRLYVFRYGNDSWSPFFFLSKDYSHTSLCLNNLVSMFDNLSKLCLNYRPNKFYVIENVSSVYEIQFAS